MIDLHILTLKLKPMHKTHTNKNKMAKINVKCIVRKKLNMAFINKNS